MSMHTLLAVPSGLDEPGVQARIVAHPGTFPSALDAYRARPDGWAEVGLMRQDGTIRCLDPRFAALRDDVPLMAGVNYTIDTTDT